MSEFRDRLGEQLETAFQRESSRRRAKRARLLSATGAIVLSVAAVVAVGALRSSPAVATVDVDEVGELVYVRLLDDEFDAGAIERAVRDAGLDVDVAAVPVGPSLVGRFVRGQIDGTDLGTLRRLDEDGDSFAGFVLPAGWDGHLRLDVGRPAEADEGYVVPSNALSGGEPLACSAIVGSSPAEATRTLEQEGITATWRGVVDGREVIVDQSALTALPWADQQVTHVLAFSPTSVVAYLSEDGVPARLDLRLTAPADCG